LAMQVPFKTSPLRKVVQDTTAVAKNKIFVYERFQVFKLV